MRDTSTASNERFSLQIGSDTIAGTVWTPQRPPTGVIIVNPATATPERFYRAFAEYLAGRDLVAVTYDYRGTGASGSPREHKHLRMRDWMSTDVPAVADWTHARFPELPMMAIGHSLGGHALTLGYGIDHLDRFALVASHVAATRKIRPFRERLRVRMVLNVAGPVLSRTLGVMPGKKLGLGEDMPSAAMLEWGSWTRRAEYFFDDPSMNADARAALVAKEVLAIGAVDDLWASPAQVDALTSHLSSAHVERRSYSPEALGLSRPIGHHGLLHRKTGEKVWPELVDWLTMPATRGQ